MTIRSPGEFVEALTWPATVPSRFICNELGEYGYNRDGKKGKKQIVIGLLTADNGEPLAVRVFKGNTSDPQTVAEQITTLTESFGIEEVVFVGDRGMVNKERQGRPERGRISLHYRANRSSGPEADTRRRDSIGSFRCLRASRSRKPGSPYP